MSTLTLTSKGHTTIPKDIRKRLNLHPWDRPEFVIDENSRVLVLPTSIAGCGNTQCVLKPHCDLTNGAGARTAHRMLKTARILTRPTLARHAAGAVVASEEANRTLCGTLSLCATREQGLRTFSASCLRLPLYE